MDNLRDRIAAVIDSIRIQRDGDSYQMADAVMVEIKEELNNEYNKGYGDGHEDGWCEGWDARG